MHIGCSIFVNYIKNCSPLFVQNCNSLLLLSVQHVCTFLVTVLSVKFGMEVDTYVDYNL